MFLAVIGTARIIWGGSMKRYGVRPSVCLIRPLQYYFIIILYYAIYGSTHKYKKKLKYI